MKSLTWERDAMTTHTVTLRTYLGASLTLLAALGLVSLGCSNRPGGLSMPPIDAGAVAKGTMASADVDGDGALSGTELRSESFGLRYSVSAIDANGDRSVTEEELRDYVQTHWLDLGAALTSTQCKVMLNHRPLSGATVIFEPVDYMKGSIRPASGVTRGGVAYLDIADEDRPHENAHGAQCGVYLVRISKKVNGRETIPPQYNADSTLQCEVAKRAGYKPGAVVFDLR